MSFILADKRNKILKDDVNELIQIYVVKKDDLDEFVHDIKQSSEMGIEGVTYFTNMYGIDPREIHGYGTSEYNFKVVDKLLRTSVIERFGSSKKEEAYMCYGAVDHFNKYRVTDAWHTTAKDSWKCLMTIMGLPKYLIIRRVVKVDNKLSSFTKSLNYKNKSKNL